MSEKEYEEWRARGGVIDLSSRVKLRLTGADRVRYLNGQVTANIKTLAPGQAIPACVTTAKGKLCADVFVSATYDALWIDAEAELHDSLPARLERYIVADDVTIEDVTQAYLVLHFTGPDEADFTRHFRPSQRANRLGIPGLDKWLKRDGGPPWGVPPAPIVRPSRAIATPPPETTEGGSPEPQKTAEYSVRQLRPELAELIRIEAGVPRWGRELTEETLPPEAGLERTHIDYAKGCYIGQEVISRLKSVGHVNRQLAGFISAAGEPLEAGWPLFAPGALEKPIGHLTSAAYSFALAKPIALGYLRRGSPTGALLAGPGGRTAVTVAELPLVRHFSLP